MTTFTQIPWGPIGEEVYRRSYSRTKLDGNKETWAETVDRVVSGTASLSYVSEREEQALREHIFGFKAIPAGRHLWMTGTGQPYTRNCWRSPWTTRLADHFEFSAIQLLTGGGVGANYSTEYLVQSPTIAPFTIGITCSTQHPEHGAVKAAAGPHWIDYDQHAYRLEDTREAWAEAWGREFDAATGAIPQRVVLDVTALRPFGAPVRTFGGTASGPVPFVTAAIGIWEVLRGAVGRHLRPTEAMQADHYIAGAVVSGGVRRSARMSIVHWQDPDIFEFINCKPTHEEHWTTNISVEVDENFFKALKVDDPHADLVLRTVVANMHHNGEPGFYNSALAHEGETGDVRSTNPCGEVTLEEYESCNIGSVNLAAFGTDTGAALLAFRLMTRFLVRSTLNPPTDARSAAVETRNRRIGVGFFGFQEWAAAHGVKYSEIPGSPELAYRLDLFRRTIRQEADTYCDELGISRCIKVTSVAPNGTISQLPGTVPGIQSAFARHFIRRVQYTWGDPGLLDAYERGLHIEDSIYAANTAVVSYPVQDSILDRHPEELIQQSDEVSIHDQLSVLAFVTRHFASGSDGNGISFTANFDQGKVTMPQLLAAVRRWLPEVKGITAFPTVNRPQQPYEPISRSEFQEMALGRTLAELRGDSNSGECRGAACPIR